jgi:hypothetical protein
MERDGSSRGSKEDAYEQVAARLKIGVRSIFTWVKDFEALNYIRESKRGKHAKTYCPILEDEIFRAEFKLHVKENSKKQGEIIDKSKTSLNFFLYLGEKNLTCDDLAAWVNSKLGLEEDDRYGESKFIYFYT